MYKTFLVEADIEDGRRLLKELEKRHLEITAAFWFHEEDKDEWKLVIVSPDFEKGPTTLYRVIAATLKDLSSDIRSPLQFPPDRIRLMSLYSLVYKTIKQHSGPVGGPVREGPVLDAYIYKMT